MRVSTAYRLFLSLGLVVAGGCGGQSEADKLGKQLVSAMKEWADHAETLATDPKNADVKERVSKSMANMKAISAKIDALPKAEQEALKERLKPELKSHADRANAALERIIRRK